MNSLGYILNYSSDTLPHLRALEQKGWVPENETDEVLFLATLEEWDRLEEMGLGSTRLVG